MKVTQQVARHSRFWRPPEWVWPALIVAANLALGILLAARFGLSFDEPGTITQGERTLQAYSQMARPADWYKDLGYYGPFFFALSEIGARLLVRLTSAWTLIEARHFFYFLIFQGSVLSVYYLCRQVSRPGVAVLATVLFASQPLLFGHAFINPKDTPFMTFFLMAVAAGVASAQRLGSQGLTTQTAMDSGSSAWRSLWSSMRHDWLHRGRGRTWALIALSLLGALAAIDLLVLHRVLEPLAVALVRDAYTSQGHGLLGPLFRLFAQQAGSRPLGAYLQKTASLFRTRATWLALLSFVPAVIALASIYLPTIRGIRPRGALILTISAGVLLGLATSIRIAGPLAGVLVSILILARSRLRGLVPLAIYWIAAAAACYLTWPYLWGAPVSGFVQSWNVMSDFPWNHQVLFQGLVYLAGQLPWTFKVIFALLQLTEPVLILSLVGLAVTVIRLRQRRIDPWLMAALAAWCLLPYLTAIASGATAYDNSRQFLFALPPLFILAAVALEAAFARLTALPWRLGIAVLTLVPGAVALVRLYPYDYVYFNSLAGGVQGAYRYYELDYWGTAYREAMAYVDTHASPNAIVAIADPWRVGMAYARPDLKRWIASSDPGQPMPEYAVLTTRSNVDLDTFPGAPVVYAVRVPGAVLAVVQRVAEPAASAASP